MADFREDVLEHIQLTSVALDSAKREMDKHAAAQARVATLIPAAVKALVDNDRIDPADQEKAAAQLQDPEMLLKILIKTADPNNTVRPRPMGAPQNGPEKRAAAGNSNYCGLRTSAEKESDRRFREHLLG